MANMKYSIKISALDAFTKPMQGMAKIVKSFTTKGEQGFEKMADKATLNKARLVALVKPLQNINREIRRLGADTGLDKTFKWTKNFGEKLGKIGIGLSGAAVGMMLISQQATKHDALAKSVGLSGKSLSAWGGVVAKAGFDTEHVVDLVEEMNNKFGELESLGEMSSATDSLKMLGLRFKDIKKLKPEEQFQKIMQAAAAMDDKQIGASAVDMLLGGEANKMLGALRAESEATGKSIGELIKEQERLNLTSEEGKAGNAKMAAASLKLFAVMKSGLFEIVGVLGKTLAPLITKLTDWFIKNFDSIRNAVRTFANYLKVMLTGTEGEVNSLIKATTGFAGLFLRLTKHIGTGRLIFGALAAIIAGPLLLGIGLLTVALIKMSIAMTANPIGLIVMAIAAAIIALIAVVYYFKDEIMAAFDAAKGYFLAFWEFVKKYNVFSVGSRLISAFWDGLKSVWGNISAWFQSKIDDLIGFLPDWAKEKLGFKVQADTNATTQSSIEYKSALPEAGKNKMRGDIKVRFENAPENMRLAENKTEGDMNLDTDVGYGNNLVY